MTHESGHVIVEEGSLSDALNYKTYGIKVWYLIVAAFLLGVGVGAWVF